MCTISTQTKYQNQEPTGTIMKHSLQCLVPTIPGALGFLLPKATQEGPLLCGVALKNRCGKSKPATTIAVLTAQKYNSRNPKEQTRMPSRLHSAGFPGQWLSSLLCVEYIVPWTLQHFTFQKTLPQDPVLLCQLGSWLPEK